MVAPERTRRLHPVAAGDRLVTPPVSAITRSWGIEPVRINRIGGDRNVHWAVHSAEGRFVLRCYRRDRDLAAIGYEFAVLAHLQRAGWPVACPVGEVTIWGERWFALFPALPGQPRGDREDPARTRERGSLLAALHAELACLPLGQRSNWQCTDEFVRSEASEIIALAQARLAQRAELVDPIIRYTCQTRDALAQVPADLPRSVVHGDFVAWNLRWQGDRLSGVLDFDDVRFDLRAADVAAARRRATDEVVAGYRRVGALDDEEVRLLAPLWCAYTLLFLADLLRAPALTPAVVHAVEWCVREIAATEPAR